MSGDTPISALATLVLFFICALNDDMASSLNDLRSSMAFSYNDNLCVHLWHTYGEIPSSSSTVMSNIAEILEDHSFLMPALLKRLIVFSTFVHSLHTFTEAIASKFSKHASNRNANHFSKMRHLFLPFLDKTSYYVTNQDLRITRYLN